MGDRRCADRGVELLGPEGEERTQFLAGEPLTLRLRVAARAGDGATAAVARAARRAGPARRRSARSTAELGWDAGDDGARARFEVEQLPLADGRFHLRLGLTDETGEQLYHWLDDALAFVVYPAGEERGVVRLEGRWTGEEIGVPTERSRR